MTSLELLVACGNLPAPGMCPSGYAVHNQAGAGNNTGIVVPEEVIDQPAAGKRPPVLVNVNGYEYRNTVGVMGGKHIISPSAAVGKDTPSVFAAVAQSQDFPFRRRCREDPIARGRFRGNAPRQGEAFP